MVQVLKDSIRDSIIDAANREILKNGIDKASMRTIAANAHMTVGNVYRYFKNKDELILTIVDPVLKKIDSALMEITNQKISFENIDTQISYEEIISIIDLFADKLIVIYHNHPLQLKIIMKEKVWLTRLEKWLSDLIKDLSRSWDNQVTYDSYYDTLANSICQGMFYAFVNINNDEELKIVINKYLNNVISGLRG